MKKIGIISELNLKNTNYGNRLQSYALNHYLNENYKEFISKSIIFNFNDIVHRTKLYPGNIIKKIKSKIIKQNNNDYNKYSFEKRVEACNNFTEKNVKLHKIERKRDILSLDYDEIICGSDVVWSQFKGGVNRLRFLNFKAKKDFIKCSYAASFGENVIPRENLKYVTNSLKKFNSISVREKSSIGFLKKIGINNSVHVCDPTLLLEKKEWINIEKSILDLKKRKYIFTYLLGKSQKQRKKIREFAHKKNLIIVNIPHANMVYNEIDNDFSDINIHNCSPEEWIWLIHNAEFIFTDSFHGCVFSIIFEKKFWGLKRENTNDINIRITDFLDNLGMSDKFLTLDSDIDFDLFTWNYKKIEETKNEYITNSKEYINKIISFMNK